VNTCGRQGGRWGGESTGFTSSVCFGNKNRAVTTRNVMKPERTRDPADNLILGLAVGAVLLTLYLMALVAFGFNR
jgi:hypothetical protein